MTERSPALELYVELARLMRAHEGQGRLEHSDLLRDAMDPVWHQLTTVDREWLDSYLEEVLRSVSVAARSPALDVYVALARLMRERDHDGRVEQSDMLRDAMDPIWRQLAPVDRVWLDSHLEEVLRSVSTLERGAQEESSIYSSGIPDVPSSVSYAAKSYCIGLDEVNSDAGSRSISKFSEASCFGVQPYLSRCFFLGTKYLVNERPSGEAAWEFVAHRLIAGS